MVQPRKPAVRLVKAPVPDYVLRVELKYIKPAIWRRIVVPGSIRLGKLHVVLQLAMGWEGGHLHEFVFGETNYGEPDDFGFQSDPPMLNEARVTLSKALGGLKSFTYIYDYGDNWQHRIKVEKALVPDPDMRRPMCLDGQNACPPEDVGGVPGYADFLGAITDPTHEEHDHFLEWCGGSFDPAAFDLVLANQRLSEVKF
ncbi:MULTISPECIES: plasmid pRiA4b ORF-3 family protein [Burkholderia]|uniref:Plasmid pRiA4b ORF-3 family protein n=5 Tax=Burkholderia TaxID=32008 RepID=A0A9Q9SRR9_9BURK|nr:MULTISPECIES: plasmid pRiA4b ORF-3 family protein [Burkholderia]EKS9845930.1 plasmid pRiA4b ORF-3 family protein [Burkholderia cepacia]AJY27280.1 plasmid pRiA4b ORF-3-like family protein [Burkholderia thailandensis 34]KXF59029.1 transposase [Burkholderia thailandensis]MDN7528372.1 plasmid pRiA4b ORF-3 family protein [Burkholderia orbicola]MDN7778741.1 plasmid pRiA4b ORF-3 family protein [Burkholderia orbicola]